MSLSLILDCLAEIGKTSGCLGFAGEMNTVGPTASDEHMPPVAEVQEVLGSPTEIADDSENEHNPGRPAKLEKRKREARQRDPRALPVPGADDEEDELDSPSKRPLRNETVLTACDIRDLLAGHLSEMKAAWRTFQGRLDHLDGVQEQQGQALDAHGEMLGQLRTRTKVVEKDLVMHKQAQQQTAKNLDDLTEEVKNMKVQWGELQGKIAGGRLRHGEGLHGPAAASDPWATYLQHRQDQQLAQPPPAAASSGSSTDKNDMLTDEEKRTLVLGGWKQDTRRAVIDEESQQVLSQPGIKSLIDAEKLLIYGPRRSVGMLRFTLRENETHSELRNRMWETIKLIANMKIVLESTKEGGDHRTLWASFVKTKAARAKSALVSMVRRVSISLALDAKNEQGGIPCIANTQISAYDCDWSLGTIWCGLHKLASATRKQPKEGELVLMSGGWVSLTAVSSITGCTVDEAKLAFEREL